MKHLKKIFITAILLLACIGSVNAADTEVQTEFEILMEDQIKGQELHLLFMVTFVRKRLIVIRTHQ